MIYTFDMLENQTIFVRIQLKYEKTMFASLINNVSRLTLNLNYHLGFVDRFIESSFANYFRNKKSAIVTTVLNNFISKYPQRDILEIKNRLEKEANRVCDFTDRAILRGNIKKLKYTFWAVAIGSTISVIHFPSFWPGASKETARASAKVAGSKK